MRAGEPVIAGRALIALLALVIIYSGSGLCAVHQRLGATEESGVIFQRRDWTNLTSTVRVRSLKLI